ncbi:Peptidoglycan/xylan/chitin deacetylase, PgdA/CDA1 family [Raineyella antarctica]|uniref:Peptidoglycan/xylan/chitin deacetylase, PgdA/CDA1 family n=2 Tax=Raineyella antarctica TaxID=1577474 RepID=A0A1G6GET7_9ACTN|nr:Peptidoglycan/xylan/chitin deacetylase, PgdA/CDA1 family [Raineyella antarctica]
MGVGAGALSAAALTYWVRMSSWSQRLGPFPWHVETDRRVVALTFDDGPNEPYTSQLADLFVERGVHATFFQVGLNVKAFPDATRRLLADGHEIGNHSWSHDFTRCLRDSVMADEILRTQDLQEEITGQRPTLYRPPWLWRSRGLFRTLREQGLTPVSGEFAHEFEPFQIPAAWTARRALGRASPGKILIFHDGYDIRGGDHTQTVRAVQLTVDRLRDAGYEFVTVPELLALG